MLFEVLIFYILTLSSFHLISFFFFPFPFNFLPFFPNFPNLLKSFMCCLKWLWLFLSSPFPVMAELCRTLMFWISFCFSVRTESKLIAWYPLLAVAAKKQQNNRQQEYNHIFPFTVFCDLLSGNTGVEFSVFACINQVESCQVILSHAWFCEEVWRLISPLAVLKFLSVGVFPWSLRLSD